MNVRSFYNFTLFLVSYTSKGDKYVNNLSEISYVSLLENGNNFIKEMVSAVLCAVSDSDILSSNKLIFLLAVSRILSS